MLPPKFTGFFPKWKAPQFSRYLERSEWIHVVTRIQSSAARKYGNFRQMVNITYRPYRTKIPNRNFQNFVINDSQYSNLRKFKFFQETGKVIHTTLRVRCFSCSEIKKFITWNPETANVFASHIRTYERILNLLKLSTIHISRLATH